MSNKTLKIYCAGPLFNPKEQEEMADIASALEKAGYFVFLPQRDGLRFAKLLPILIKRDIIVDKSTRILNMAIFSLDVFQIMDSQGLVVNMNGRVPDEGAMVEAGIAWSHNKAVVIFRNDTRTLVQNTCNPLAMGLSDFKSVDKYEDIPGIFNEKFAASDREISVPEETQFGSTKTKGKRIRELLTKQKNFNEIADLLIKLFVDVTCVT